MFVAGRYHAIQESDAINYGQPVGSSSVGSPASVPAVIGGRVYSWPGGSEEETRHIKPENDEGVVRTMRAWNSLAMAVCLFAMAPAAWASDSDTERVSLTGLTTVSVVVEDLSAIAKKSGLVGATLQTDVERRLKAAGISVTSDADAYLYVHVTVADPGPSSPLPYIVEVALMQEVTLPRGLKTRTPLQSATWWVNSLGLSGPDRLRSGVTDKVAEFADNFVRAFRSVNPR
jgi:hypothetical protein